MRPRVVVCGSYHQDGVGLARLFRELEATGCRVLSPISIEFKDNTLAIVRAEHEDTFSIDDLERWHLRALAGADFVVLHAPDGYIGLSGAYEIGYANAIQKPVFSLLPLRDEMLNTRITRVGSIFEVLELLKLTTF